MTFGSLFAGIGGMDLGLERAGMKCVWQVEIDDYCRKVLEKHWPDVKRHDDVRTFPPTEPDEWRCDLIAGGFPCIDISNAGECAGIDGEHSGLWSEFYRIIRVVRPDYVLVENVAALLTRGMGAVLGDLAESGFDAEWDCLPAGAFGSRQFRDRVFIVGSASSMDNSNGIPAGRFRGQPQAVRRWAETNRIRSCFDGTPWAEEPGVDRVAYGVSNRTHRLRGLGNAVVPQVAQWLGERIMEAKK